VIIWLRTLKKEAVMTTRKKIIDVERVRRINGGFGFIPHRFLTEGFFVSLNKIELLLYFFLILVSDKNGLSYYSYERICEFIDIGLDEYLEARNGLLEKDLIAFEEAIFQVLELPPKPKTISGIGHLISKSLKEAQDA
jgi:hypothetical protein